MQKAVIDRRRLVPDLRSARASLKFQQAAALRRRRPLLLWTHQPGRSRGGTGGECANQDRTMGISRDHPSGERRAAGPGARLSPLCPSSGARPTFRTFHNSGSSWMHFSPNHITLVILNPLSCSLRGGSDRQTRRYTDQQTDWLRTWSAGMSPGGWGAERTGNKSSS